MAVTRKRVDSREVRRPRWWSTISRPRPLGSRSTFPRSEAGRQCSGRSLEAQVVGVRTTAQQVIDEAMAGDLDLRGGHPPIGDQLVEVPGVCAALALEQLERVTHVAELRRDEYVVVVDGELGMQHASGMQETEEHGERERGERELTENAVPWRRDRDRRARLAGSFRGRGRGGRRLAATDPLDPVRMQHAVE